MNDDLVYDERNDINKIPDSIITRLKHYFLTYKQNPNVKGENGVEITDIYGRDEAYEIIRLGREDYNELFPGLSVTAATTRPDVEAD
jgi:inorganic pyrophosphatase